MRLSALLMAATFVALAGGTAVADSMATPTPSPMHHAMKSDHMMKSDRMKSNTKKNDKMKKSDHMMASPKPTAKP